MQPSSDVREALIDHGVELLEEAGLARFTGREVARRAGVSHGAPRRHFPTVEALLSAVAARGFADLAERFARIRAGAEAEGQIVALAREYVAFAEERPAMFESMFRHDLLEKSGERLREHSTAVFAMVLEAVASTGVDDPMAATVDLWAGVHGVAALTSRRALDVITPESSAALIERQVRAHLGRHTTPMEES